MNQLSITTNGGHAVVIQDRQGEARTALALWLASYRSENTRSAYKKEIEAFASHAGHEDVVQAVAAFLALEDGKAHAIADAWRVAKLNKGLSPASINRSMAALNSLVASARRHGFTALRLEAKGVRSKPYRDTKGPGVKGIHTMLAAAGGQAPKKAARDTAIIRLACSLGLRRGEIVSLDVGHVDLEAATLAVMGKGQAERIILTLPANTKAALAAWLAVRGTAEKTVALFISLSRGCRHDRMSGRGIYHLIRDQLGERAGVKARPHGLRHTAITTALDTFNGDFRKTRFFSRHASLDTVRLYDDNRADHAGQVAQALDAIFTA